MKKILFLLLNIALVLLLLIGCTKDIKDKEENTIKDKEKVTFKEGLDLYNLSLFDSDKLLDGYRISDIYDEDGKLMLLLSKSLGINKEGKSLSNVKLCSYDHSTKEMLEIFKAENIDGLNFYYLKGEGIVYGQGYLLTLDGKTTKMDDKEIEYIYSPDKKHYAYADEKNNLIIKNSKTDKIIIELKSTRDMEVEKISEHIGYRAYAWLDNKNFMYSMTGWEWSRGVGIVNVNTLENIDLEDSFGKSIYEMEDKKLIVSYYPHGDVLPFNVGYYDLDKKPYVYHETFNTENYPQIYVIKDNFYYQRLLSTDMNYVYTFEENYDVYGYVVKIFSISEEKLVKEIKIAQNKDLPFEHMSDVVLVNDNLIAISGLNSLYIVELEK